MLTQYSRCTCYAYAQISYERRIWLSVCLSVTRLYWVKTDNRRIMCFHRLDAQELWFFETKFRTIGQGEHCLRGLQSFQRVSKDGENADFRNNCLMTLRPLQHCPSEHPVTTPWTFTRLIESPSSSSSSSSIIIVIIIIIKKRRLQKIKTSVQHKCQIR